MRLDMNRGNDARGKVLAFPASRETANVRALASMLLGLGIEDGRREWLRCAKNIERRRRLQGFAGAAIAAEISRFAHAVTVEMTVASRRHRQPSGSAAPSQ